MPHVSDQTIHDLIIVGSGPAGYTAAVYAARAQLDRVTLTSRAFGNDRIGPFCTALAELLGKDMVLPMNTGAEAVESGLKVARKWGYEVRGVAPDRARIAVMAGGFHGRTTTIVGFSTDPDARGGFGPFTPGFDVVPYGDADALASALRRWLTDPEVRAHWRQSAADRRPRLPTWRGTAETVLAALPGLAGR